MNSFEKVKDFLGKTVTTSHFNKQVISNNDKESNESALSEPDKALDLMILTITRKVRKQSYLILIKL